MISGFSSVQCSPSVGKLHCDYTGYYTDYTLKEGRVENLFVLTVIRI